MSTPILIGTRGSKLALAQSEQTRQRLADAWPQHELRLEVIKTTGDIQREISLTAAPGKGVFVKELEDALLSGAVALAVHSLKDMPTELPGGLVLSCIPKREDPRDVLLMPSGPVSLASLPEGARVGTGSPRRGCQLAHHRPDLQILDIRGNVDTRIQKMRDGQYDAIVLAAAGLRRLGMSELAAAPLSTDEMLPAVGQGALALECRTDDDDTRALLAAVHDDTTATAARAERAFLTAMGGGCAVPVAAHATFEEEAGAPMRLTGLVASPDGKRLIRKEAQASRDAAEACGRRLAEEMLNAGGREILQELSHD